MSTKRMRPCAAVRFCAVGAAALYMIAEICCVATSSKTAGNLRKTPSATVAHTTTVNMRTTEAQAANENPELVTLEYPFNLMSADWDPELIRGFVEYKIPDEFAQNGGYLPVVVQQYAWCICKRYGFEYPIVLSIIEQESGYRYDAVGSAKEKGYMQIAEVWHSDRMSRLGAEDLLNPYMNIAVGVDYIAELMGQYHDIHLALSIYNRGFRNSNRTGALDLWDAGYTSTEYSRGITARAWNIRMELMGYAES